jgi:hypothetical protein
MYAGIIVLCYISFFCMTYTLVLCCSICRFRSRRFLLFFLVSRPRIDSDAHALLPSVNTIIIFIFVIFFCCVATGDDGGH